MIHSTKASLSARCVAGKTARFTVCALIASMLLAVLPGCAAKRPTPLVRDYLLASRFDPAARQAGASGGEAAQHEAWFRNLRARGFNCVVIDALPSESGANLLSLAAESGLRAYVTTQDMQYFLLTGKVRQAGSVDEWVRKELSQLSTQPGFAGVAVLGGYPRDHVQALISALQSSRIDFLIAGQSDYGVRGGAVVAWLDTRGANIPHVSQMERFFVEFNGEIMAGWNDGLVMDTGVQDVGAAKAVDATVSAVIASPTGDEDVDESLPVESVRAREFAAESLVRRARAWGPRLIGCSVEQLPKSETNHPAVSAVVFRRDQRRFLFIFNQSSEPVRGVMRFPATMPGGKFERAVEVPASAIQVAGRVFAVRQGELAIQPMLRAGDAALFELF